MYLATNKYFLEFIEPLSQKAAKSARKMEELIFEDPASSIVKARLFAEEIIDDVFERDEQIEKPAYVSSLYERVLFLSKDGVLTPAIQKLFDTVRIVGNKAAHNSEFNDIAEAYKLHKVIYEIAVWYYELYSTSDMELAIPLYDIPKPPKYDMDQLVEQKLIQLLGKGQIEGLNKDSNTVINPNLNEESTKSTLLFKKLPEGKSYLYRELSRLKDSAQEAIENANTFSTFKNYMHVERRIQKDIEDILQSNKEKESGSLILLCGSVGDGKSHLMAYLKENKKDLLEGYKIFNDATESFSPEKNAMETLEEILEDFSDEKINSSKSKVILAINMGVLHNFISREHEDLTYHALNKFIKNSGLFSQVITTKYSEENFNLISFGDYHSFEITEKGPESNFFSTIISKIFSSTEENPFYLAYAEDEKNGIRTMVHENFDFMQSEFVQRQIVDLVIQIIVKFKLVISARSFMNFIADVILPDNLNSVHYLTDFEKIESSVPNLLFNRKERSFILKAMSELDPIHMRKEHIDNIVVKLHSLNELSEIIEKNVHSDYAKKWLRTFTNDTELTEQSINWLTEVIIRLAYLTNKDFVNEIYDQVYKEYIKNLYFFNSKNTKVIRDYYEQIKDALFKWKGMPIKKYIYINNPNSHFRLAQSLNLKPSIEHLEVNMDDKMSSFKSNITIAFHDGDKKNTIYLEIDYPLYNLLLRVQNGYCPNKKDHEDAIKFVEFIENIMKLGNKSEEMLIHFPADHRFYKLKKDDFGAFVFEKE